MWANYIVNAFRVSSLKSCRLGGGGGSSCRVWNKVWVGIGSTDTAILGVRYAGHSKWQNIKHTKAAKDLQKNQLYNRHIDLIKLAVRGECVLHLSASPPRKCAFAYTIIYRMTFSSVRCYRRSLSRRREEHESEE